MPVEGRSPSLPPQAARPATTTAASPTADAERMVRCHRVVMRRSLAEPEAAVEDRSLGLLHAGGSMSQPSRPGPALRFAAPQVTPSVRQFIANEAGSAAFLLAGTVLALLWVNVGG